MSVIALVTADFAPNIGGVAAHVVGLGTTLARTGHEVHVVTLPLGAAGSGETRWEGMSVHRVSVFRGKPLFAWSLARWLERFMRQHPVQIAHVHGLRPLEATRVLQVPVVFTNHTSGFLRRLKRGAWARRRIARRLSHVRHVLAPSEELASATRACGYAGPVDFIPNGVDTERFCPGTTRLRADWGIGADEVVVLLSRRLVAKNGVTVFAEAAAQLVDLPVRLVFAGAGPERERIEQLLATAGMSERALFLGPVANDQMPDVYRAADLSVLPSLMEAVSISGLESLASGVPVVGTRVGGIPALVLDNQTGLLVPPADPGALGRAIRDMVADPLRRRRMGERAREHAAQHFSWQRIAAATSAVYERYLQA